MAEFNATIPLRALNAADYDKTNQQAQTAALQQQQMKNDQALQPLKAQALQQQVAAGGQQNDLNQLKIAQQRNQMAIQLLGTVRDQASYDAAKQHVASLFGPDIANQLPQQYDPQAIQQYQMQSLSLKDKLDYQLKQHAQAQKDFDSGFTPNQPNGLSSMGQMPPSGTAGADTGGTPLSVRNNNPGNMRGKDGNFQSFSNPDDGLLAMKQDLLGKIQGTSPVMQQKFGQGYQPTLTNIISTWAPASDNNDPQAYAAQIAQKLGVDPNAPLKPEDVDRLSAAMIPIEGGQKAAQYFGPNGGQQSQEPADQTPQFHNKSERDAYYRELGKTNGQNASNATTSKDYNLDSPDTGQAYLDKLSPEKAATVKLVADSDEKSATILSRMSGAQKMSLLAAVQKYNPNYSANSFGGIKEFNTGKLGNTVRSLNVADSHLELLDGLVDALGNGNVQVLNSLGNKFTTATGGAAPTDFNTAKQVVADEVTKAIIGAGGTGEDRDKAARVIDAANSPDQLKGAIKTYRDLMQGQLGGLKQQYQRSTGKSDFDSLLSDSVRNAQQPKNPAELDFNAKKQAGVSADELAEYKKMRGLK